MTSWENGIDLEEMGKIYKKLKAEIDELPPALYVTSQLPFDVKKRNVDGKIEYGENGLPVMKTVHVIQTEYGMWISPEAANKLNEMPDKETVQYAICTKCGSILGPANMAYDADYSSGERVITRAYYLCNICGTEDDIDE